MTVKVWVDNVAAGAVVGDRVGANVPNLCVELIASVDVTTPMRFCAKNVHPYHSVGLQPSTARLLGMQWPSWNENPVHASFIVQSASQSPTETGR